LLIDLQKKINIGLFFAITLLISCSWGRYPCPQPIESKNSEKDGSGIMLIQIKKNKDGLLKNKQPKRIRKKRKKL
jgi:hypothetical protein